MKYKENTNAIKKKKISEIKNKKKAKPRAWPKNNLWVHSIFCKTTQ